MDALAAARDAAVQMIDTSITRVHQHGACVSRNKRQSMGRSRGGLTSKIHAVVDRNGLPVRLRLLIDCIAVILVEACGESSPGGRPASTSSLVHHDGDPFRIP